MRRLLYLLCALLALTLCACGESAPREAPALPVALWTWRGLPMEETLEALCAAYNASGPERPVTLRVFDSESAMGAAMNEARPDLIFCPGSRAFALYAQGKLREAAPAAALSPAFSELDESVGRAYFPLGAETPLLAFNATAYLASPATDGVDPDDLGEPMRLCALAAAHGESTAQPFFAADSWAGFFSLFALQSGADFAPDYAALRGNAQAAQLYNALAEAAFSRGLYTGAENAAELVKRGYAVSALLPSRALSGGCEGLVCRPAPLLDGGKPLLPARTWGLAVTAPDAQALPGAEAFLGWLLQPERAAAAALEAKLLPGVGAGDLETGEGSPEQALLLTGERFTLRPAPEGEDWDRAAADFDARMRAALALLD